MRPKLYILSALASGLFIITGCKTASTPASTDSAAATAAPAPAAAPATAPAAPAPEAAAAPAPATMAGMPGMAGTPIRIRAGAGPIKDATGVEWLGDTGFSGGDVVERPDQQIANTTQPEIYRAEHYSMDSFTQKVPNGKYDVKLHFCETYDGITGPGQRVFTMDVQGTVLKDFDVYAKAGGASKAYIETVPVTITTGELTIKFTAQTENPQINAIEIIPAQ